MKVTITIEDQSDGSMFIEFHPPPYDLNLKATPALMTAQSIKKHLIDIKIINPPLTDDYGDDIPPTLPFPGSTS